MNPFKHPPNASLILNIRQTNNLHKLILSFALDRASTASVSFNDYLIGTRGC